MTDVVTEVRAGVGWITLDRPKALNALSLLMIRDLAAALLAWSTDPAVRAVAIRGQGREQPFGTFCAGGDIRFFHAAALAGNPELEDFFTEEYELDHLVHTFPKPYIAFLDGIVIGAGMGIAGHGRAGPGLRLVTERTRMSMPETNIGLFPDVGGGYFLGRCPGRLGEYLALTGSVVTGTDAIAARLADRLVDSARLPALWDALGKGGLEALTLELDTTSHASKPQDSCGSWPAESIDRVFGLDGLPAMVSALETDNTPWARETAAALRARSPLMLHVTLEQLRRGRNMSLADNLRMERGMVRHCFHIRSGGTSETVEGIRAFAVDKDRAPRWNPARIEDVTPEQVKAFFDSPWPAYAHPLRQLCALPEA